MSEAVNFTETEAVWVSKPVVEINGNDVIISARLSEAGYFYAMINAGEHIVVETPPPPEVLEDPGSREIVDDLKEKEINARILQEFQEYVPV